MLYVPSPLDVRLHGIVETCDLQSRGAVRISPGSIIVLCYVPMSDVAGATMVEGVQFAHVCM